jgi:hypothetical protein
MKKAEIKRISEFLKDLEEGLYELDGRLKAVRHYYLGDEEKIRLATAAVAGQIGCPSAQLAVKGGVYEKDCTSIGSFNFVGGSRLSADTIGQTKSG